MLEEVKRSRPNTGSPKSDSQKATLPFHEAADLFPELPGYVRTPFGQEDAYIHAYERLVLFAGEQERVEALMQPSANETTPATRLGKGFSTPAPTNSGSHYFSSEWMLLKGTAVSTFEEARRGTRASPTTPFGDPATSNPSEEDLRKALQERELFDALFPHHDILVRESAQRAGAEMFCEAIVKELVEKAALVHTAHCFDRVKEGYTAFSVWDEIRDSVAAAFVPQDCSHVPFDQRLSSCSETTEPLEGPSVSPFFGYLGDIIDRQSGVLQGQRPVLPPSHYYFGLLTSDVSSTFLLTAAERVSLAKRRRQALASSEPRLPASQSTTTWKRESRLRTRPNTSPVVPAGEECVSRWSQFCGSIPPDGIPMDEYCRYVVPLETGIEDSLTKTCPSHQQDTVDPSQSTVAREKGESVSNRSRRVTRIATVTQEEKPQSRHVSVAAKQGSIQSRGPNANKQRKAMMSQSGLASAAKSETSPRTDSGNSGSSQWDALSTAVLQVPNLHLCTTQALVKSHNSFARSVHFSCGQSVAPTNSDSNDEDQRRQRKTGKRMVGVAGTAGGMLHIKDSHILPQRDVAGERARLMESKCIATTKEQMLEGTDRAGVTCLVLPTHAACEAMHEDVGPPDGAPVQRESRDRLGKKLTQKGTTKFTERRQLTALYEQRQREKLFVEVPPSPHEAAKKSEKQLDIRPEPGVLVQQPSLPNEPRTQQHRPETSCTSIQGLGAIVDGGAYIPPVGKQRWCVQKPNALPHVTASGSATVVVKSPKKTTREQDSEMAPSRFPRTQSVDTKSGNDGKTAKHERYPPTLVRSQRGDAVPLSAAGDEHSTSPRLIAAKRIPLNSDDHQPRLSLGKPHGLTHTMTLPKAGKRGGVAVSKMEKDAPRLLATSLP